VNPNEPIVIATEVSRTFGRGSTAVVAVHGTSCAVRASDRIALVGASGSGKSTLLHLLAGLDDPTAGNVTWPGLDAAPRHGRPGLVGVVFQGPSLLPALDAVENVAMPLLLAGEREADSMNQARDALTSLGLDAVLTLLPEQLSGGQAQRVAVARALVAAPRLVLADEPTGQLDHATAATVVDTLLDAADRAGAGLVIATHDPVIADRFPTRWHMDDGALVDEALECSR
jgi:putative ABC transport system ATP-binding protein